MLEETPEEREVFSAMEQSSVRKETIRNMPQRTWVGLTDEDIWTVLQFRGYNTDTIEIAKAIEAKLKEKTHERISP